MHKNIRLLAATIAAAILVGCSGGSGSGVQTYVNSPMDAIQGIASQESYSAAGTNGYDSLVSEQGSVMKDQKITYTASVNMESTEFDSVLQQLSKSVKESNAYYESSDMSGNADEGSRQASFRIKISVSSYSDFLADLKDSGNVLDVHEIASNITANHIDVESRLSALTSQRTRLNALADAAESTADLLEIENQLSDVQYEIENYTSQMRNMDNLVSYSTIDVSIREVAILTPVHVGFGSQVLTALDSGWSAFIDFVKGLIIGIVYLTPILVIAAIVVCIICVARKRRKKNAPHKQDSSDKEITNTTQHTSDTKDVKGPIYNQNKN